jgi:predicted membrane protein
MRKSSIFWGLVLIVLGFLLMLSTFGILRINFWQLFWPAALIIFGAWFILRSILRKGTNAVTQHISLPIENTTDAEITFKHGAGRLNVEASFLDTVLLEGDFTEGVEQKVIQNGNQAKVQLSAQPEILIPFGSREGLMWTVGLNRSVSLRLNFQTGASESTINLHDLKVSEVVLETDASKTTMTLPVNAGMTRVEVKSGAAAVDIIVPENVAGHIRVESALAGININNNRFPALGGVHESPGYATAPNKVDIFVSTRVGSVNIQ